MKRYYFDHAATTPLCGEALAAMLPCFSEDFANPSSSHALGRDALERVDRARDSIAALLGVKPKELFFTSGGTEADNWAIKGVAYANRKKGNHIVVSAFEHPAVTETALFLRKEGYAVDFAPVTEDGFVDLDRLAALVRPDTVLVGVMAANNEIGTLQPVAEAAEIAHAKGALFFSDAVQSTGVVDLPASVDLFSCSAHKVYGPKGIGLLYVKEGTRIERLLHGGHQEHSLRGGTTPTPLIVGFAKALEVCFRTREQDKTKIAALRDRFLRGALALDGVSLNGDAVRRLPSNANLAFSGVRGEVLLHRLDRLGVCASTGSACLSGAVHPSHTLLAMGKEAEARCSLRFTFGRENTEAEIDEALERLRQARTSR